MTNLQNGKDYHIVFDKVDYSHEERARLIDFIAKMFEHVPVLVERAKTAIELRAQPLNIVFTSNYYDVLSPAVTEMEANTIYLRLEDLADYGTYDKQKECVVHAPLAIVMGHELFHLGDESTTIDTSQFLTEEEHQISEVLKEYLIYEKYQSYPNREELSKHNPNFKIPTLSQEAITFMKAKGLDLLTNRDLELKLGELSAKVAQGIFQAQIIFENAATQSELEISEQYSDKSVPARQFYINAYLRQDANFFWQSDKAVRGDLTNQFSKGGEAYPEEADWCDDDQQVDLYALPPKPLKP